MFDRRTFLNRFGMGLGGIALSEMLANAASPQDRGVLGGTHFAPRAKRIIYLFMSGGPSHLDLFDYKPLLNKRNGERLSGLGARRAATDWHVGESIVDSDGGISFQVHAASAGGRMVQRVAAAHGEHRGRHLRGALDVHGVDQSWAGRDVFPDGLADRRTSEHGGVAEL